MDQPELLRYAVDAIEGLGLRYFVTGSMASKRGMAMNPAYVASKHGVLGLTRAIAVEMVIHQLADRRGPDTHGHRFAQRAPGCTRWWCVHVCGSR